MSTIMTTNHTRNDIIDKVADVLRKERATVTNIESAVDKAGVDRGEVNATFGSMQYWTWTPHGLYRRLAAENGVKRVELTDFLEEKLISMTRRIAGEALGDVSALMELSPEAAFTELGKRISKIMFSPSSLSLYRLVLSEAPRFPDAAGTFFTHGPHQAIGSLKALISHFCERGQFRECDHERASRGFLSMLLGNLYLEVVLGCRTGPNERDLESRTKSVVQAFLRGLGTLSVSALKNCRGQMFASMNEKNRIGLLADIERSEMPAEIAS